MRLLRDLPAHVVWIALLLSDIPAFASPAGGQQGTQSNSSSQTAGGQQLVGLAGLPDSPGAIRFGQQDAETQRSNSATQSSSPPPAEQQTEEPKALPQTQSSPPSFPQKPVGTAVAEPLTVSGIAASQPAGVAIAPGKQHRVLKIVLSIGAIAGAGVAIGTVVALTQATPSKPSAAR
jgi:hypothetical protein